MIFAGKNPVRTCHVCANQAISRGLMEEVSEEYFMIAVVMTT